MAFHAISDLRPMRMYNWRLRVRVSSKWCERNYETGRRNGLNLILIDEEHGRVRAWIGETVLHYFDKKFVEGQIYEIRNFVVKYYESEEMERCFNDDKFIIFSNLTKASLSDKLPSNIPLYVWKFTELADINHFNENVNHFIDVVGLIYSVEPAERSLEQNKKKASSLTFCITDFNKRVNVTFNGKLAAVLDVWLTKAREYPVVLSMTSCKIICTDNSPEKHLCNTAATRMSTKANSQIACRLRTRFWEEHGG